MSGLDKYIPNYDSLKVVANLKKEANLFFVWKEIEQALIHRSKFYSLIDIYGHYANRGDVVNIETIMTPSTKEPFWMVVDYFSQTSNCGQFMSVDYVKNKFKLSSKELFNIVNKMRELRFDIRTFNTHPIIGLDNIICTYPFPLLSPKALVESKASLNKLRNGHKQKLQTCFLRYYKIAENKVESGYQEKLYANSAVECAAQLARTKHAFRGAALTLLGYKLIHPEQDVRSHKSEYQNGFAARTFDTRITVPFLLSKNLPRSVESHWLTQTLSFAPILESDIVLKTQPKKAGILLVKIVNYAQTEVRTILEEMLTAMFVELILIRNKNKVILTKPKNLSIDIVSQLLNDHFFLPNYKKNAPRLPQLAVYAIYMSIIDQMKRFEDQKLEPIGRMRSADRKAGTVGDVVLLENNKPVEAVEIKFAKPITHIDVLEAIEKVKGASVSRYYLLSTEGILNEDVSKIKAEKLSFLKRNGCEIIVNGVIQTICYYLRLLPSTNDFIFNYTSLVETDLDTSYEHRVAWNELCSESI